jgi:hypothetical protein
MREKKLSLIQFLSSFLETKVQKMEIVPLKTKIRTQDHSHLLLNSWKGINVMGLQDHVTLVTVTRQMLSLLLHFILLDFRVGFANCDTYNKKELKIINIIHS